MTVDTPLALFTTLFGWQFYNTIWNVLLGSGIALLPFVGALIEVFATDREDGTTVGNNPGNQYQRLEAKVLIMLGVVAIGAQPTDLAGTSLGPNTLSHVPYPTLLEPDPVTVTTTTSDSTFGETAFGDFEDDIPVPVWWYAVMSVSQGINRAVISGFPELESLRDLIRLAQIANINDPAVAAEAKEFYSACYIPARSRFLREKDQDIDADQINFMGSEFFVQGDYQTRRARRKVQGFPFDPVRDADLSPDFNHQAGKPFCAEWWLGTGAQGRLGLRGQLLEAAEVTSEGLTAALTTLPSAVTPDAIEDTVIERVLNNSRIESFSNENFRTFDDGSIINSVGRAVNEIGVTTVGAGFFALFMDVVTLGTPILQPMILMGIFALLPFAIVASRYSLSFLVGGAVVIFTVSFWPVLWYMATWVDDQLAKALFPEDAFATRAQIIGRSVKDTFGGDIKSALLNMTTSSLFLFLPIVFSAVMGIAGVRAVGAATALTSSLSGGGEGVKGAARGAQTIGKIATSKIPTGKGSKGK